MSTASNLYCAPQKSQPISTSSHSARMDSASSRPRFFSMARTRSAEQLHAKLGTCGSNTRSGSSQNRRCRMVGTSSVSSSLRVSVEAKWAMRVKASSSTSARVSLPDSPARLPAPSMGRRWISSPQATSPSAASTMRVSSCSDWRM